MEMGARRDYPPSSGARRCEAGHCIVVDCWWCWL